MKLTITLLAMSHAAWTVAALYYRRKIRQRIRQDAAQAEQLLLGVVRVDGIDLPLPTDTRWEFQIVNDGTVRILILDSVRVDANNMVYVGPKTMKVGAIPYTTALGEYAKSVWTAYYSRLGRASAEKSG